MAGTPFLEWRRASYGRCFLYFSKARTMGEMQAVQGKGPFPAQGPTPYEVVAGALGTVK
jgi:hypothetical protein